MFPHLLLSLLALLALYQPTVHGHERLKRNNDDNGATTTLVSITLTTTIHLTSPTPSNANGAGGPCENFYGACVVYGGQGSAAYTTTVYATGPSPSPTTPSTTFTRTTTLLATTTVSDSGACANYDGACVVYATNGAAATTVYGGQQGNGQGFIGGGGGQQGGQGFIGAAGRVDGRDCMGLVSGLVGLGLVFAVAG